MIELIFPLQPDFVWTKCSVSYRKSPSLNPKTIRRHYDEQLEHRRMTVLFVRVSIIAVVIPRSPYNLRYQNKFKWFERFTQYLE